MVCLNLTLSSKLAPGSPSSRNTHRHPCYDGLSFVSCLNPALGIEYLLLFLINYPFWGASSISSNRALKDRDRFGLFLQPHHNAICAHSRYPSQLTSSSRENLGWGVRRSKASSATDYLCEPDRWAVGVGGSWASDLLCTAQEIWGEELGGLCQI